MAGGLLLLGCGRMGGALLSGWIARADGPGPIMPGPIMVVEPNDRARSDLPNGVESYARLTDVPNDREPVAVILAVKPQSMDDALAAGAARFVSDETVFLSVAAGKTVSYFRGRLGAGARIVRAMPNTPAAVGRGIAVCFAGPGVDAAQASVCAALLSAVGEVAWIEDEGLIDPVTALSGGGPAYVFLLMETLARAGVAAGLPEELAARLAEVTVSGAGELARLSDEPPTQLRKNVTSPNGTTERALAILMAEDGIQPLFDRAIAAATARSRELAGLSFTAADGNRRMAESKSGSVHRVREALAAVGHPTDIVEFDETTRSSVEAAAAIGCSVSQIAKSLIFRAGRSGRPVLVIACGDNRVNENAVAKALGEPISRADPKWVREATGFAIGGVAPLGHVPLGHMPGGKGEIAIFIDADLKRHDRIWAAAGSPRAVFETDPNTLIRITGGAVLQIA